MKKMIHILLVLLILCPLLNASEKKNYRTSYELFFFRSSLGRIDFKHFNGKLHAYIDVKAGFFICLKAWFETTLSPDLTIEYSRHKFEMGRKTTIYELIRKNENDYSYKTTSIHRQKTNISVKAFSTKQDEQPLFTTDSFIHYHISKRIAYNTTLPVLLENKLIPVQVTSEGSNTFLCSDNPPNRYELKSSLYFKDGWQVPYDIQVTKLIMFGINWSMISLKLIHFTPIFGADDEKNSVEYSGSRGS